MPVVGHEGIVPKVCGLECPPNDLTNVDDTGQFVFVCTDPVSNVRGASQSRKIALERFDCARWRYQASMKLTAPRNSRQKFRSAPSGWCFENLTHLILSG